MSNITEYTLNSLIGAPTTLTINGKPSLYRITDIIIPKIQRDYAQGRTSKSVTKIRKKFLNSLYTTLTTNSHQTLDFVYGDVSLVQNPEISFEPKVIFTPLDGQQRLTTLFLLHLYISKKEQIPEKQTEFLNHFSYATRNTSRDFCKKIVEFIPDINELNNCEDPTTRLSFVIKNQSWFQYEWKYDPTILSMLVMLDSIDNLFKDTNNLWDKLLKSISFYFLPLSDMGLSDELYIKMNSRGKPLTPFEHFKAAFEKNIENIYGEDNELCDYFRHHLDVEWADIFFPYRGDNNIIDEEMMRYFKFVTSIICYEQNIDYNDDEDVLLEEVYSKSNPQYKDNIKYLKSSFDCFMKEDIKKFFNENFIASGYEQNKVTLLKIANGENVNLFEECCNTYGEYSGRTRNFPLNRYIIFYAVLIYFLNKKNISLDDFISRIRIIRNLVLNSEYEIRDDKPNRMLNILTETKNIILNGTISPDEDNVVNFSSTQKQEERIKLDWLKNETNPTLKDNLLELESHYLLRGCIAVVGLENTQNFHRFTELFTNNDSFDAANRALLSLGDYSQFINWRYQIGAKTTEKSWLDLFHPSEQRPGFDNTKRILNQLLELDIDLTNDNLNKLADNYINDKNTPKDWRYYLIKYSDLRNAVYGMYYWNGKENRTNQYEIILMKTEKSLGGKNWDLFSYYLWQNNKDKLHMEDYSFNQDNPLEVIGKDINIYITNNEIQIVKNGKLFKSHPISQLNGIDTIDRIELAEKVIKEFL